MFDNVKQEVTFSKDGSFTPENNDLWCSYPFEIKSDRIIVQMPVNGEVYELFFDSGGYKPGLFLNKDDWNIIKQSLNVKQIRKSHYYNYFLGRLPCQIAKVSELSMGEKKLKNTQILIREDSKDLSMLSLDYFQDTVVVLDFVNNLLWIKKT